MHAVTSRHVASQFNIPLTQCKGVIAYLYSAIAAHTQSATAAPTRPSSLLLANPLVNIVDRTFRKGKPKKRCYVGGKLGCFHHTADKRVLALRNYRRRTRSHVPDVPVGEEDPEGVQVASTGAGESSADDADVQSLEDVFTHVFEQEEALLEASASSDATSTTSAPSRHSTCGNSSAFIHD